MNSAARTYHLLLEGVSCNSCVGKIRQSLQQHDPHAELEVELEQGRATLCTRLDLQQSVELLASLGYPARTPDRLSHHLQVEGVKCDGCLNKIRKALTELDADAEVEADLPAKRLKIRSLLVEAALIEQLEGLGYPAHMADRKLHCLQVEGVKCDGCLNKIRKVLAELDAEVEVDADLPAKRLQIRSLLGEAALIEQLEGLGYPARIADRPLHCLQVEGVRCNGCLNKIRKALAELDAEVEVDADLPEKRLQIRSRLNENELIECLAELGYTAQSVVENSAGEVADSDAFPEQLQGPGSGDQDADRLAIDSGAGDAAAVHLALSGMTCAACVRSVEEALQGVAGVAAANVNFGSRNAQVFWQDSEADADAGRLISAVEAAGYGAVVVEDAEQAEARREANERDELRTRIRNTLIGLGLGIPLMLYGLIHDMSMVTDSDRLLWGVVGMLTLAVLLSAGRHFFTGAWKALRVHNANMDTLIAVGTGAAWLYSMVVVLFPGWLPAEARGLYFEAAAMIIGLINLGQALELRARGRTTRAIRRLLDLRVKTARVLRDGQELDIAVDQVALGELIRVRPGEQLPVDGEVVEGHSLVDESMLTGEPVPVAKAEGDELSAGTLNRSGTLLYRATRVGRDTALAQIIEMVRRAQNSKPPISQLADRVSAVFVPTVLIIAVLTALAWYNLGPEPRVVYMLVTACTVLIIACPCALGLATPISTMIGVGKAAEYGILIRNGEALQRASQLDTLVLDKTGTITLGRPSVTGFRCFGRLPEIELLGLARALEVRSEHPLAEAVVSYAEQQGCRADKAPTVDKFNALAGMGIEARTGDRQILLGNARLMERDGVQLTEARAVVEQWQAQACTVIWLAIDGRLEAVLAVSDPLKPDAAEAIHRLQEDGIRVIMLTGDNPATAAAVAELTGLDEYRAGLMPEDKLAAICELQAAGNRVGMAGDGINDAPALSRADVGFAIGSGTDVAIESADITLMRGSLHGVVDAIELSRACLKNIRQNLWGAFLYNSLGIPVAAGVLYPMLGILLNPVIAGVAMSLSSVTVVSNANRLRLFRVSRKTGGDQ